MSSLIIEKVKVNTVIKHPHADRLDIIKCFDWDVVVQSGQYKVGDDVIYIPVGTILSQDLEIALFPPDSKIKLHHRRIKSIKIRGMISQGFVIDPRKFDLEYIKANVTKYETPEKALPSHMGVKKSKKAVNKNFNKYSSPENIKYYDRIFQDNEEVVFTEKLHGSNSRFGYVQVEIDSCFKKILNFFGLLKKYEWVYGSHNVQLQNKLMYKGYYNTNIYAQAAINYKLKEKLRPGEVIYGEIVGPDVQKHYHYGCKNNERHFYAFDVMINGKYLDYLSFKSFCKERNIPMVPELYIGPYHKEKVKEFTKGDSTIGNQKIREGIIVKGIIEINSPSIGRRILKSISEEYYLFNENNGTDFH